MKFFRVENLRFYEIPISITFSKQISIVLLRIIAHQSSAYSLTWIALYMQGPRHYIESAPVKTDLQGKVVWLNREL